MFMHGVAWDDIGSNTQQDGLERVWGWLYNHPDPEILVEVIELAKDSSKDDEVKQNAKEWSREMLRDLLNKNLLPTDFIEDIQKLVTTEG